MMLQPEVPNTRQRFRIISGYAEYSIAIREQLLLKCISPTHGLVVSSWLVQTEYREGMEGQTGERR